MPVALADPSPWEGADGTAPVAGAGGGSVLLLELGAALSAGGTFLAPIALALASKVCFVALLHACCTGDFFFVGFGSGGGAAAGPSP